MVLMKWSKIQRIKQSDYHCCYLYEQPYAIHRTPAEKDVQHLVPTKEKEITLFQNVFQQTVYIIHQRGGSFVVGVFWKIKNADNWSL